MGLAVRWKCKYSEGGKFLPGVSLWEGVSAVVACYVIFPSCVLYTLIQDCALLSRTCGNKCSRIMWCVLCLQSKGRER